MKSAAHPGHATAKPWRGFPTGFRIVEWGGLVKTEWHGQAYPRATGSLSASALLGWHGQLYSDARVSLRLLLKRRCRLFPECVIPPDKAVPPLHHRVANTVAR